MQVAVAALLRGPTADEAREGYVSDFGESSAHVGFTVHRLGADLAAVNFDPSIRRPRGPLNADLGIKQVIATLGQFQDVRNVAILIGGQHLCRVQGEC